MMGDHRQPVRFGHFSAPAESQPPQPRGRKRRASDDGGGGDDDAKRARGEAGDEEAEIRERLLAYQASQAHSQQGHNLQPGQGGQGHPHHQGQQGQPADAPPQIPLRRQLANLDRDALLNLLGSLLQMHPGLEPAVAALLPRPSVASASALLSGLLAKLDAAFPYTKWGPDRGDYSFNRVRPQLEDLLQQAAEHLAYFADPRNHPEHEYPGLAMPFLAFTVQLCARLPEWQNPQRTAETRDVLLARALQTYPAVLRELGRRSREEGRVFPAPQLKQWAADMQALQARFPGFPGVQAALGCFERELGWLMPPAEPQGGMPAALAAILGEGTFASHPVLQGQGVVGVGPGHGWEKRG
ncbi:hypothetical protein DFJ74DRAFT_649710 [Hyaloraphidium curvatum]|nr:hypothetical protein DFJ74DRAFT_649710 [Hyaloraphidium curvatum]